MPTDIVIPGLGESVTTAVILEWPIAEGAYANRDDVVCVLETDKINMEIPAPASGVVKHTAKVGDTVEVGQVIGTVDESASAPSSSSSVEAKPAVAAASANGHAGAPAVQDRGAAPPPRGVQAGEKGGTVTDVRATPLAKKMAAEHGIDLSTLSPTGPGGKVSEHDVERAVAKKATSPNASKPASQAQGHAPGPQPATTGATGGGARGVRRERMSTLRQRVASRLVEAQHTAAMLTTFNECDMTAVMELRKKYKESFEKRHGVGLGFMSFFVKAAVAALQQFPQVNAYLAQDANGQPEIEYHDYCDISLAVGTPKGLVVPVLRNAETLSSAQIEQGIKDLAVKARDGKLTLADLQGGTFTITNGGIYGSLMSTPILNPPQTGILGMHAIKNRAVEHPVGSGQVAIRPMMYLALSYDHRLIDGADAVQFLVAIKNAIEEPERLVIGM